MQVLSHFCHADARIRPVPPDRVRFPLPPQATRGKGKGKLVDQILAFQRAGIENLLVVGPAGCGKTTCARLAAEALDRPFVLIPCNLGTPAYTFTGRRHPITGEYQDTEFTEAYKGNGKGFVILLDDFDRLDPGISATLHSALENGSLATPVGSIPRHRDTLIIATGNNWGNGADRLYVASNQQDAATLRRFEGGRIAAEYDADYEDQYDAEVVAYCRKARKHIDARKLRRVVSTGMIKKCCKHKLAGNDWKAQVTADWSDQEREGLQ